MGLIPKNELRGSSVTEKPHKTYKLVMMSHQKAHKGNKLLDLNLKKFYKNETTFTFEKYVTKLKGLFNMLEKYGVPLYEE